MVVGFAKVEEALNRGEIAGLFHASDAAEGGKAKLDRSLRPYRSRQKHHIAPKSCFDAAEISLAR